MCCLFPLPTTSYSIRPQYLIFFSFQWFPKLFTDDYLANYMTGVEATKVKVYNSCYHDNALEVFLKVGRTPYRTHSLGDSFKCRRGKGLKTICLGARCTSVYAENYLCLYSLVSTLYLYFSISALRAHKNWLFRHCKRFFKAPRVAILLEML